METLEIMTAVGPIEIQQVERFASTLPGLYAVPKQEGVTGKWLVGFESLDEIVGEVNKSVAEGWTIKELWAHPETFKKLQADAKALAIYAPKPHFEPYNYSSFWHKVMTSKVELRCECGAAKVNSKIHSTWCPEAIK